MLASPGTMKDLSDYEKQRLQLIARNRAKLEALGIHTALQSLNTLLPKKYAESQVVLVASPRTFKTAFYTLQACSATSTCECHAI
jgi:hypothetical protein